MFNTCRLELARLCFPSTFLLSWSHFSLMILLKDSITFLHKTALAFIPPTPERSLKRFQSFYFFFSLVIIISDFTQHHNRFKFLIKMLFLPPNLVALPRVASPSTSGDCTFEDDTCGWINPSPRRRLDDLDFLRVQASEFVFPTTDHSTGAQQGNG